MDKLPLGHDVTVKTTVSVYGGLTGIVIGYSPYSTDLHRIRFTPPAVGQPDTDYLSIKDLDFEAPKPHKFEVPIQAPALEEFLDEFNGQGRIRQNAKGNGYIFEVEAKDLWEAATITHEVVNEAEANSSLRISAGEAVEVEDFGGMPVGISLPKVKAHEVDVPKGVAQVVMYVPDAEARAAGRKNRTYWPVDAVKAILRAHGVEVED